MFYNKDNGNYSKLIKFTFQLVNIGFYILQKKSNS